VQAGKPEALGRPLEASVSAFEHLLAQAKAANDAGTPRANSNIVEASGPTWPRRLPGFAAITYITMVADMLGVGVNSVLDELGRGSRPAGTQSQPRSTGETRGRGANLSDELYLMLAVAANREYFADVRKSISLDDLADESARIVYVALEECFPQRGGLPGRLCCVVWADEGLEQIVMSRLASEEFGTNAAAVIGGGIRTLRSRALERRGKSDQRSLGALGAGDAAELRELLEEKMYVDRSTTGDEGCRRCLSYRRTRRSRNSSSYAKRRRASATMR